MEINRLFDFIQFGQFMSIGFRLFGIVLSVFYIVFSIVIIRQVQVMKKSVQINDYGTLRLFAYIQFLMAIFFLFYSLFIL